jgi:hypothetical protein
MFYVTSLKTGLALRRLCIPNEEYAFCNLYYAEARAFMVFNVDDRDLGECKIEIYNSKNRKKLASLTFCEDIIAELPIEEHSNTTNDYTFDEEKLQVVHTSSNHST